MAADQPNDLPPEQQFFYQEKVGFLISGDWFIAGLAEYAPDINYGITNLPVPDEGMESSTWAGGWSMVIPEGAKNPEGAWEFLQYIAGEEGQRVYSKDSSHLPTFEALGSEEGLLDERHAFFAILLPQAKSRPPLPVGALYWDELTTAWQATYLNQANAGRGPGLDCREDTAATGSVLLAEAGCVSRSRTTARRAGSDDRSRPDPPASEPREKEWL